MGMKAIRKLAVPMPKGDGSDDVFWLNIGVLLYDAEKKKFTIKLNAIPVGVPEFEGWINCFEFEDKDAGEGDSKPQRTRREPRASSQRDVNFDDDIPF
jgi:hypothetical protein